MLILLMQIITVYIVIHLYMFFIYTNQSFILNQN